MDVRTLCLGILSLGDATGYEIKKLVADGAFSFFSEASYGSIYPALTKLMDEGLVTCREETQDGRPDKKIYTLTDAGRKQLTQSLKRSPGPDKQRSEFLAALLFAEAVTPDRVGELVEDRVVHHRERIATLEAMLDEDLTPAGRFVLEYGITIQKAALQFLRNEGSDLLSAVETQDAAAE
ncbi:MAG: PadR family transcriptional regulator [Pseudomonadota bacterium]